MVDECPERTEAKAAVHRHLSLGVQTLLSPMPDRLSTYMINTPLRWLGLCICRWHYTISMIFLYACSLCVKAPDLSLGMARLASAAPDGNSTSSSWWLTAKSTARCCSLKGYRLISNSTLNFILLIKISVNLKKRWKVWVWFFIYSLRRGFKQTTILSPALTSSRSPASPYPAPLCEHIRCTWWSARLCLQTWPPSDNPHVAQMVDSQQHREPVGKYSSSREKRQKPSDQGAICSRLTTHRLFIVAI